MHCYILVENHTYGLAAHRVLDAAEIPNRISPTPRVQGIEVSCGMCLLVPEEFIDAACDTLRREEVAYERVLKTDETLKPNRDHYC